MSSQAYSSYRQDRHPGSLLDFSAHNPQLVQLMDSPISVEMVDYVARQAEKVVRIEESPNLASYDRGSLIPLRDYVFRVCSAAHVTVPVLLSTLIYLERLRTSLPVLTKEHRVFLATLVIASKYLNDSTLKNAQWSQCSGFPKSVITAMEIELLGFLDYDLRFDEEEACSMFARFMVTPAQRAHTRAQALDKFVRVSRARVQAQQTSEPPVESNVPSLPIPRVSSTPSGFPSAVRTLAKRLSNAHLSSARPQPTDPSPMYMYSSLSTGSTISTSSSDVGSLIEDTGSSSGSSSGWNTSDSESETEEYIEPRRLIKPASFVRSIPSYTQKNNQFRERSRKSSDTSSIRTITQSPLITVHSRRCSAKRSTSISTAVAYNKDSGIPSSATMPSIAVRGVSGNFLTRMWGVARGQALGQDKVADCGDYTDGQPGGLRRLALHSKPSFSRGLSSSSVDSV
ncbi:hypothetical protein BT96DRAFT_924979 [Gymnopus androsaceus JB14]|uniref:Cyclin N-terminal domain-containing protein n=1 Tax=Gymnopus androsaceus JB14 TaxID=1447944 RepID=A0A6A4H3Q7_9AGAR|nr:hypothetical protein BT96DRAFT_924979 [Gymnopus androsaceus JB14]